MTEAEQLIEGLDDFVSSFAQNLASSSRIVPYSPAQVTTRETRLTGQPLPPNSPAKQPLQKWAQWDLSIGVLNANKYYFGPSSTSSSHWLIPGTYRAMYVSGACNYSTSAPGLWGVAAYASDGVTKQGPRVTWIDPYPSTEKSDFVGTFGYYASQSAAESASAGTFLEFEHQGGPVYMQFIDENYSDNAGGPIVIRLLGPF